MIERVLYPLAVLADRWGCAVDDLLHLGIRDRAQVCVNIYGLACSVHRIRMETEAPEPAPGVDPLTDEELREAHAHDSALESWKTRTTKDMPHGVFEIDRENLRFICMPDAFPHELHEAMKFDGGWWQCEFDPPVLINLDHLCMLHEEVQRLDLEIPDAASAAPDFQNPKLPKLAATENAWPDHRPLPGPVVRWPWGSHHTEALGHLEEAAIRWWKLYDPAEADTAPTNKQVSEWLQKERGLSQKMAGAMASILRADGLPTGPRK